MGRAYPQELRDRVLAARDRGMKTRSVANMFGVAESWVRRIMQRRREHGQTAPRPCGGATVVKIDMVRLRELVERQPDATVNQLHAMLGIDCSVSAVDMALRRLGMTFKKRQSTRRSRTGRTSPSNVDNGVKISQPTTREG